MITSIHCTTYNSHLHIAVYNYTYMCTYNDIKTLNSNIGHLGVLNMMRGLSLLKVVYEILKSAQNCSDFKSDFSRLNAWDLPSDYKLALERYKFN